MKFLSTNGLLQTPQHTVYSIRHTFMDRMRAHGFPEELQNYLMGHKHPTMGAQYGQGYALKDKLKYMRKLAVTGSDSSSIDWIHLARFYIRHEDHDMLARR